MIHGYTFLDPWMLTLLLALPFVVWRRARRPGAAVDSVPLAEAFADVRPSWRQRLRAVPMALRVAAIACAIIALARPVELRAVPRTELGVDIALCVDASSSMAEPMSPASADRRIDVARAALEHFVARRPDDRLALLRFAAHPDLVCPPTLDHDAILRTLAAISTVTPDSDEDMTGIGNAVAAAGELLSTSDATSRVIVVLTDGEENVSTGGATDAISPRAAAAMCRHYGIRLHAITAGGAPDSMRTTAAAADGRSFLADDPDSLAEALATIDSLERSELSEPETRTSEAFFAWLVVGLASFSIGLLLELTVLGVTP